MSGSLDIRINEREPCTILNINITIGCIFPEFISKAIFICIPLAGHN